MQLQQLESSSDALFNLIFDDGRQNFTRLLEMLYDRQLASTQIKLMILFHSLILEDRGYAQLFLAHPKTEFKGLLITRKQPQFNTAHKYTETAGDATLRGPETSVSVSRSCATRRYINDDVDYATSTFTCTFTSWCRTWDTFQNLRQLDLYEDAKNPQVLVGLF